MNPAGVGERSRPQNLTFDCEFIIIGHCMLNFQDSYSEYSTILVHTGCLGSTSSTTVIIMEPISASSEIPVPGELNCE